MDSISSIFKFNGYVAISAIGGLENIESTDSRCELWDSVDGIIYHQRSPTVLLKCCLDSRLSGRHDAPGASGRPANLLSGTAENVCTLCMQP